MITKEYLDIKLGHHSEKREELNKAVHTIFSIGGNVGLLPSEMIEFILDEWGIDSYFFPIK